MHRFLPVLPFVFFAQTAPACECLFPEPRTRQEIVGEGNAVFVGRPLAVSCIEESEEVTSFEYEFVIERIWSGPEARRVSVRTPFSSCGFMFEPGKSYLISTNATSPLFVDRCSYSGSVESSRLHLSMLGKPRVSYRSWWRPRARFSSVVPECIRRQPAGGCGISFEVPVGWSAELVQQDETECEIGIRPEKWVDLLERARWDDDAFAIRLTVYRMSLDAAAQRVGFERSEEGRWLGSDRGGHSEVDPAKYPGLSGWRYEGWFRGFAKADAIFTDQSRIYSGAWVVVLLQHESGAVLGIDYNEGNPDIDIDRNAAAELIANSVRVNRRN